MIEEPICLFCVLWRSWLYLRGERRPERLYPRSSAAALALRQHWQESSSSARGVPSGSSASSAAAL